jgi:Holliday junction resolvasome RuvABC endonuclease subunit
MKINEYNGIVLALDLASKKTGYAIYKDRKIVKSGTWKFKPESYHRELYKKVRGIVKEFSVTELVSEDIFMDSHYTKVRAYPILAECKGIINLISELLNIPISFYRPIMVKQHIWGRSHNSTREQEKRAMIIAITKNYGYTLESLSADDEADAIGLLITFLDYNGYPIEHPKQ